MGVNSLEWVQVRIQKTLETTGIENSFGALLQIGKEINWVMRSQALFVFNMREITHICYTLGMTQK